MIRSYAGGVREVTLTAPITDLATSATVSGLVGMPDGSGGPFSMVIGKGTANEEKVLVSSATGGTVTFNQRGYDGTSPQVHGAGEELRMVITSIDAAEANAHVNATLGVHGLDITDSLVGINAVQSLTGKTIDGLLNTVINVDPAGSPLITSLVSAEASARLAGDAARYSKTEADALFPTFANMTAADTALMLAHTSALNPHIQYFKNDGFTKLNHAAFSNASLAQQSGEASNRYVVSSALQNFTASDANLVRTLGQLVIPAGAVSDGLGNRMWLVMANIKGFTTNGASSDVCRYHLGLNRSSGGATFFPTMQIGGEGPRHHDRLEGAISVAANGVLLWGLLVIGQGATSAVDLVLTKISGAANVTPVADEDGYSYFQAVQLT